MSTPAITTSAENVSTGKPAVAGSIYRAPVGTTLPTDATTALNSAFQSCGYVSEDGVSNSLAIEADKIKAWGGDVVQTMETGREDTFKFALIESLNPEVLKATYGDDAVTGTLTGTAGIAVSVGKDEHTPHSWVVEMLLKGGVLKRIVIPSATVTEVGEVIYKDDEVIAYALTLLATLDSSGKYHYEYLKKPTTTGGGT